MSSQSKKIKILAILSLVLTGISFIWLIINTYEYINVDALVVKTEPETIPIAFCIFYALLLHFFLLGIIVLYIRSVPQIRFLGFACLVLGSISLIGVFVDWGLLSDIFDEYPLGVAYRGEWIMLLASQVLHFLYYLCLICLSIKVLKVIARQPLKQTTILGENLFLAVNIIGLICSMGGLLEITLESIVTKSPHYRKWYVLPIMVIILLPYVIVLCAWLFRVLKEKTTGYFDEKQKYDLAKAGATAWLLSIPAMLILFILNFNNVQGLGSILWLPFYIYVTLFIFSASSLLYYKGT